jgi:hypothetical protein
MISRFSTVAQPSCYVPGASLCSPLGISSNLTIRMSPAETGCCRASSNRPRRSEPTMPRMECPRPRSAGRPIAPCPRRTPAWTRSRLPARAPQLSRQPALPRDETASPRDMPVLTPLLDPGIRRLTHVCESAGLLCHIGSETCVSLSDPARGPGVQCLWYPYPTEVSISFSPRRSSRYRARLQAARPCG